MLNVAPQKERIPDHLRVPGAMDGSPPTITDRQKLSAMYLAARIQPERCIGCPAERSPPRTQPVRSISGLEAAFSAASAALGSRRRSRLAAALAVLQLCGGWECGLRHVRTC